MADGADIDLYSDDIDQGFGPIKVNANVLVLITFRIWSHLGKFMCARPVNLIAIFID